MKMNNKFMKKYFVKKYLFTNLVFNFLFQLSCPKNLSLFWNFGSMLGMIAVVQILTGVFLSFFYTSSTLLAFSSISFIMRDVNYGWLIRLIHLNGATYFFLICYLHMMRGIYYNSFKLTHTWGSGVTIYLVLMGTAFMGYVLPWGQMSFWGATVITNLLSTIPILGEKVVQWVWGGFCVGNMTLNCFFSLHFILPFVLLAFIVIHLMSLHMTGSSNPISSYEHILKVKFHSYYMIKDGLNITVLAIMFWMCMFLPYLTADSENFIAANPLSSPIHIQPEWYFLYAYAILRSIPNKLGGVLSLLAAVSMFLVLVSVNYHVTLKSFFLMKLVFWTFIANFLFLTWLGSQSVEDPFILLGQLSTVIYFAFFFFTIFFAKVVFYILV